MGSLKLCSSSFTYFCILIPFNLFVQELVLFLPKSRIFFEIKNFKKVKFEESSTVDTEFGCSRRFEK